MGGIALLGEWGAAARFEDWSVPVPCIALEGEFSWPDREVAMTARLEPPLKIYSSTGT